MLPVYFLRIHHGLNVIRIAADGLSVEENNFNHSDWNLEPNVLSAGALKAIHLFCLSLDSPYPNWSALATRQF